jgi:hypothetical protein
MWVVEMRQDRHDTRVLKDLNGFTTHATEEILRGLEESDESLAGHRERSEL